MKFIDLMALNHVKLGNVVTFMKYFAKVVSLFNISTEKI